MLVNDSVPTLQLGFLLQDDPNGDYEPDGYANESSMSQPIGKTLLTYNYPFADNIYINSGKNNITRTGTFTSVPYSFPTNAPPTLKAIVEKYSGVGNI